MKNADAVTKQSPAFSCPSLPEMTVDVGSLLEGIWKWSLLCRA